MCNKSLNVTFLSVQQETGNGETLVDHSQTPPPKPTGPVPSQMFSLPPDIANILGGMAQEFVHKSSNLQPATVTAIQQNQDQNPLNENIQQMLNKILVSCVRASLLFYWIPEHFFLTFGVPSLVHI